MLDEPTISPAVYSGPAVVLGIDAVVAVAAEFEPELFVHPVTRTQITRKIPSIVRIFAGLSMYMSYPTGY